MPADMKPSMKLTRDRARQRQWRAKVPEARTLVEVVLPQLFDRARQEQKTDVPEEWRAVVSRMREIVHTNAKKDPDDNVSTEKKLGYEWSFAVGRVSTMLEHLTNSIQADIGLKQGESLASVILLKQAVQRLERELRDSGTEGSPGDSLEDQYRLQEALKPLSTYFDDVQMQRLRALQIAEGEARFVHIPTPDEVAQRLDDIAQEMPLEPLEKYRKDIEIDWPTKVAVMVHSSLTEVDEQFAVLDPLVVLEEFAEASNSSDDGRPNSGGARTGPVRALARLAVMCGALGFEQGDNEDFDNAAERARTTLLVTRSRIKKSIRAFQTNLLAESSDP